MGLYLMLVVAHFIGDFICQSDWMATNKSKRWDALALHVGAYVAAVVVVVSLWVGADHPGVALFAAVNGIVHFATDAVTSRITSRLWFFQREDGIWAQAEYAFPKHGRTIVNPWMPIEGTRHWFFVAIGADQVLHYAALFITADWWLR